jgi:hypothetical protein
LQSWAKLLKFSSKTLGSADFFNLSSTFTTTPLFTVAVKQPKTAKPDGFSGFDPSDFSLSAVGRLSIGVTHYRLFLSALLHIIATVSKRVIYPYATGSKSAQVVSVVTDRMSKSVVLSGVKVFSKCL